MSTERGEAWLNAKWGEVWVLTINGVEHVQRVTQRGDFADLYRDDCGWVASSAAITAGRRIWPETTQAPADNEREALSNFLFTVYEHGSQPNALREADAILSFLASRRPAQGEPTGDVRQTCAWCPGDARGSAWWNDGRLHPSCGQIGHGEGWVPDERAVRPAQGEPTRVQFAARQSGKAQATIDALLAQANEHGIRVEVVYPQGEPSDAQIDRVAEAIAKAADADYWTDEIAFWEGEGEWYHHAYPGEYPGMAYEDRGHFREQARAALRAALKEGGQP